MQNSHWFGHQAPYRSTAHNSDLFLTRQWTPALVSCNAAMVQPGQRPSVWAQNHLCISLSLMGRKTSFKHRLLHLQANKHSSLCYQWVLSQTRSFIPFNSCGNRWYNSLRSNLGINLFAALNLLCVSGKWYTPPAVLFPCKTFLFRPIGKGLTSENR